MRVGANAADTGGDARQFLNRTALAEFLEAAQFRYLKVAVGQFTIVVDEQVNLAVPFQARDRIYDNALHTCTLRSKDPAMLKR